MIRRAFGVWVLFAALVGGLSSMRGSLPAPDLRSFALADEWYRDVGPDTAFASALLHLALGVSVWLLIAATAQLVAAVVRGPLTTAAAAMLAPRSLQRYVHGVATASFAAGLAVTPPTLPWLSTEVGEPVGERGTATLELISPEPSSPAPGPAPSNSSGVAIVQAGDSFWSIAEATVRTARPAPESPPTTAEVARYWQRLVEANAGILVVADDPDLIYRGQTVMLPPISADSPGSPPSLAP